jgi:arabinofuranosyltransferase
MTEPQEAAQNKTPKLLIVLLILVFLVWGSLLIFRTSFIAIDGKRYFCLADDAMISMQYAWNFSHGIGLVWNAGERVQGYTNLLMTLLMSVPALFLGRSAVILSIQILGLVLIPAIAYLNMKIADHMYAENGNGQPPKASIRILSFLFALSYYPLIYWSLMGMETGLLTILLLFAVLSAFAYKKSGAPTHLFRTSLCLGLGFLTRNDSLIFALLIWAHILWDTPKGKTNSKTPIQLFSAIGLYLVFVIGEFLFQIWYYGEPLPNTYILKLTGMPLFDRISIGLVFVAPFLIQVGLLLIAAIIGMFLHMRKDKLLLLALVLSSIGYQVYVGGDPWNYWRLMSPTIPLLGILFIDTVSIVVRSQAGTKTLSPQWLHWHSFDTQVTAIVLMGILVANANFLPEILFVERPFYVSANQHNVNIAVALREVTTRDATVGVFWAGAIPYFSERKAMDFLGKSDRYIAHLPPDLSGKVSALGMKSLPGHNKYDLNYSIKQLQPTYVQGFKWGSQDLTAWGKTIYIEVDYKGTDLFLRKDSPAVLWERINNPSD